MIFIDILLLIGVVCLFSRCINNTETIHTDKPHNKHNITHYIDTIDNHIIVTTVCDYHGYVSCSTLELNNNNYDKQKFNKYYYQ